MQSFFGRGKGLSFFFHIDFYNAIEIRNEASDGDRQKSYFLSLISGKDAR